jgi:hypothetical protein
MLKLLGTTSLILLSLEPSIVQLCITSQRAIPFSSRRLFYLQLSTANLFLRMPEINPPESVLRVAVVKGVLP